MLEWQPFDINDKSTWAPDTGNYWVYDHWPLDLKPHVTNGYWNLGPEVFDIKPTVRWKHVSHWLPFVPPEPPKEI